MGAIEELRARDSRLLVRTARAPRRRARCLRQQTLIIPLVHPISPAGRACRATSSPRRQWLRRSSDRFHPSLSRRRREIAVAFGRSRKLDGWHVTAPSWPRVFSLQTDVDGADCIRRRLRSNNASLRHLPRVERDRRRLDSPLEAAARRSFHVSGGFPRSNIFLNTA